MPLDFEIVDECSSDHWSQWQRLVTKEEWTALDHTVFFMYPKWPSAKVAVARKKSDGSFLGSVVWVEQDGLAILDTYILVEEARGKGIGSKLWKYALEKRNKNMVLALRSVPEMMDRYLSTDLPVRGDDQYLFECTVPQFSTVLNLMRQAFPPKSPVTFKQVKDLSEVQYSELLSFDRSVTNRDRSVFLSQFLSFPFVKSGVLLDNHGKVVAFSAIGPTCGENLFRIAPIYANCTSDAVTIAQELIKLGDLKNSRMHVYFIQNTVGYSEWVPKFEAIGLEKELLGTTLFSGEYKNGIRRNMVHVAHDNFLHFDM